jgi:hypothetical protein
MRKSLIDFLVSVEGKGEEKNSMVHNQASLNAAIAGIYCYCIADRKMQLYWCISYYPHICRRSKYT